jgi:hypothetical protein
MNDKDWDLKYSIRNCKNDASVSGYYCNSCAVDIKFHGIAGEVDYTTDEEEQRKSQQVDGESFKGASE